MLRVCFVALGPGGTGPWKYGGAERLVVELANWLRGGGVAVQLVGLAPAYWRGLRLDPGIDVIVPYPEGKGLPGVGWLRRFVGLWRAMDRASAHVYVQAGAGYLTGVVAAYRRWSGRRMLFLVTSDTNTDPRQVRRHFRVPLRDRWAYAYGLRRADGVVVQTEAQQRALRAHWRREGSLIRQGLDLTPFLHIERSLGDGGVLWIGRAAPGKRPELLVELARRCPQLTFTMLTSPGSDHGYYDTITAAARGLPNVTLLQSGTVDLTRVFARASVLVSTSSTEGYPNTFIEAWAAGLPVVSLECDPDELICRERLGRHSGSVERLERDLLELLADHAARTAIGERARAFVRATHDIRSVGPMYLRLIEALVGDRGATTAVAATTPPVTVPGSGSSA